MVKLYFDDSTVAQTKKFVAVGNCGEWRILFNFLILFVFYAGLIDLFPALYVYRQQWCHLKQTKKGNKNE
nr:MAG TPA: hypothetical protein [Caudoviricetes sp.]